MGTPYIWGHSEDRGQNGFDCSNFTAYVYHHALGYNMSGTSQTQNSSVGVGVSISQMQVGDLVIFDHGAHVGIYAGNNHVIQEGGGLQKVGYLNVAPGKSWANHITAVKRMF
ncbi:C40 family peptidase [Alicyclobacillus dauci]|uniref:NlpC/P60 family protein n=1 Tax=Alicyclobacillus dauci TaxID=1475485 RepID=A0ABY6YYF8_9BACL|nr:NlpC/P60 family protein [Alicyclobacillus dauci]WAH35659.1 NlpC/P60 family protein [Alicyclobacillus dauci]